MPLHKTPYKHGNLFIIFKIQFPEKMDPQQISKVKEALAFQAKKAADKDHGDVAETVELKQYKESHRNVHHEGGDRGNGSDEEMEDESQQRGGVRCQQQ